MIRLYKAVFAISIAGFVAYSTPAAAQCTVPNVLTNGQVADASEVMDNFYAVAACSEDLADAAVTHTGTPTAGALAVFSSPETITSADLSGDITTSGGTVATLVSSGVVPGTYINPTIAVDSKGRVTSAAPGSGGSGAPAALVLIGTHVADGTTGSVTFSALPQYFRDLIVVVTGQSTNPVQDLVAYANGDTNNANYRNFTWNRFGTGSVAVPRIGAFPGLGVPNAGSATQIQAEFLSYSSSIWKKNAKCEMQYEDSPNFFRSICEWKWQNTVAITGLEFRVASGSFAVGTVFSLYGRGQI